VLGKQDSWVSGFEWETSVERHARVGHMALVWLPLAVRKGRRGRRATGIRASCVGYPEGVAPLFTAAYAGTQTFCRSVHQNSVVKLVNCC